MIWDFFPFSPVSLKSFFSIPNSPCAGSHLPRHPSHTSTGFFWPTRRILVKGVPSSAHGAWHDAKMESIRDARYTLNIPPTVPSAPKRMVREPLHNSAAFSGSNCSSKSRAQWSHTPINPADREYTLLDFQTRIHNTRVHVRHTDKFCSNSGNFTSPCSNEKLLKRFMKPVPLYKRQR